MATEREVERLIVRLLGDGTSYQKMLRQASETTKDTSRKVKRSVGVIERTFEKATSAARGFATALQSAVLGPVGLVTGGLTALGGALGGAGLVFSANKAITVASNLEESINAVNVVFGEGAAVIERFGKDAAVSMGLTRTQFNELSTTTGSLLQNLGGFSGVEAAEEMGKLGQRAADMASVFNTDVKDAMGAIASALRGERDPIERFGVSMTEATVKAKALELGLAKNAKELTMQAKLQAGLALIYDQTNRLAGDFANTSDSLANSTKIANARFAALQAQIGERLIPIKLRLMRVFGRVIDLFSNESVQNQIFAFFDRMTEKFEEIAQSVGRFVMKAIGFFQNFGENFNTIIQWIQRNWFNLIQDMFNAWLTFRINMVKNMAIGVETIIRLWSAFFGDMTAGIKTLFSVDFINSVAEGLKEVSIMIARFGMSAFETLKSQFDLKRILSGEAPKSALNDFVNTVTDDFKKSSEAFDPIGNIQRILEEQSGKLRGPLEGFRSTLEAFPELNFEVRGTKLTDFLSKTFSDAGKKSGGELTKGVNEAVNKVNRKLDLKFEFTSTQAGTFEDVTQIEEQIARIRGGNLQVNAEEDARQTSILEKIANNTDPRNKTTSFRFVGLSPRFT